MTKRLYNTTAYLKDGYIVILEQIKNDINGNPRFKAAITKAENNAIVYNFTFGGHFCGPNGEVEFILDHLKKKVLNQ